MDDDLNEGRGSHILASVSRVRVESRRARGAQPVVVSRGPKPLWGFTYTKFPRPGESKFVIHDEVRFTTLCLIVFGSVCVLGFLAADFGLNRIKVRDVLESGGHGLAVLIGGIFSMLACVLSAIQIRSHKKCWTHPPSQKHVVRILYMVPIYAVSAWGSLTFLNLSSYIDFVRGVYEAFVIYTFMILLTKYLGGHNGVVEWMKYKPPQAWPSPMCCLKPVVPDSRYLYYLKYGALQYTILTPICSLAAVVLTSFGAFEDGVIEYDNGYPYIAFIMNCSQLVSLYCLVWLYVCVKNELAPFGPLAKFMVVKAVVFATFWQGVALAVAAKLGWITETNNFSVGQVQEMFIAACAHKYTFGSDTYVDGSLRLIMEQRALYLAEQSYKRGVMAQKEALAKLEASGAIPPSSSTDPDAKRVPGEETEEERLARQDAMAALIRKNMDDDTEGDVLFDEDLADWTSGALPDQTNSLGGIVASTVGEGGGVTLAPGRPQRSTAYDYVYAYELEHQRAEGVDQDGGPSESVDVAIVGEEEAAIMEREAIAAAQLSATSAMHAHAGASGDDDAFAFDQPIPVVQKQPKRAAGKQQQQRQMPQQHHRIPISDAEVEMEHYAAAEDEDDGSEQNLPPPSFSNQGSGRRGGYAPAPSSMANGRGAQAMRMQRAPDEEDVFGDEATAVPVAPRPKKQRLPPAQQQQQQRSQQPAAQQQSQPPRQMQTPLVARGQAKSPLPSRPPSASASAPPPRTAPPSVKGGPRPAAATAAARQPRPPAASYVNLEENPFE